MNVSQLYAPYSKLTEVFVRLVLTEHVEVTTRTELSQKARPPRSVQRSIECWQKKGGPIFPEKCWRHTCHTVSCGTKLCKSVSPLSSISHISNMFLSIFALPSLFLPTNPTDKISKICFKFQKVADHFFPVVISRRRSSPYTTQVFPVCPTFLFRLLLFMF